MNVKDDNVFGNILIYPKIHHCIFALNIFVSVIIVLNFLLMLMFYVLVLQLFSVISKRFLNQVLTFKTQTEATPVHGTTNTDPHYCI